jgi:ssRNA-specific RNase YbeY (16S rRNA maturation enzyme)
LKVTVVLHNGWVIGFPIQVTKEQQDHKVELVIKELRVLKGVKEHHQRVQEELKVLKVHREHHLLDLKDLQEDREPKVDKDHHQRVLQELSGPKGHKELLQ